MTLQTNVKSPATDRISSQHPPTRLGCPHMVVTSFAQLDVKVALVDGAGGHRVEVHLDAIGNTLQPWDE